MDHLAADSLWDRATRDEWMGLKDPPHLAELVRASIARYDALPPVERAIADLEQNRSLMIGLSKMSTPREVINAAIDKLPEFVILAELKRLRSITPNV